MYLKELQIEGFKSFGTSATLSFPTPITGIVGPNGSGKSNVAEAFRFVLGEQSMKSMRGKRGEDLIFNGGSSASRANRAQVSIVFDNTKRLLADSFDEVSVSRTVYRSGTNEYMINGTQVRHKDIVELLAKANVGSTGHHIISQGEADRILHASNEERKEMLEDGLGLKLLQYRRAEAEKKLQKAQVNIAETELILRETMPHLRHLKRQVDRYEKAKKVREDLEVLYTKYLAYETHYIATKKCSLENDLDNMQKKMKVLKEDMAKEKKKTVAEQTAAELDRKERELHDSIAGVRVERDAISRAIGRIEGERAAFETLTQQKEQSSIARETIADLYSSIQERYTKKTDTNYTTLISYVLARLRDVLRGTEQRADEHARKRLAELQKDQENMRKKLILLKKQEEEHLCAQKTFHEERKNQMATVRQSEKKMFSFTAEKNTLDQSVIRIRHELALLREDEEQLRKELAEGAVLIGSSITMYQEVTVPPDVDQENRKEQKERQRTLERKKIELEAMDGGGGEEVYAEYKEVSERVDFLKRERDDLLNSIRDCEKGIETIQKEVTTRFETGVKAVSKEFDRFFKILFGGGKSSIVIEKVVVEKENEEPETRIGVAVQVSLPRKKITGMEQLSGGERALVSIALLFAISQITPPPFLVLDETDAALDEANSRRYGDMIESLAKKSQLVVITHNRETMYRAGALYGVTMNTVGISALLSVQFDDAVQVAK